MRSMNAAAAIRRAREVAGLSKRELARRAGTSPAAIVAYESGRRDPSIRTLQRILAATGCHAELVVSEGARPDRAIASSRLADVLGLAEQLPRRPAARRLSFPRFPR